MSVAEDRDGLLVEVERLKATIGRLDEDVAGWISRAVDAEATIERVEALLDRAPMSQTGHVPIELVRAALKEPS